MSVDTFHVKTAFDRPAFECFRSAYLEMAQRVRYRPMAPGDGVGGIYLSREELKERARLEDEATRYATQFLEEEDTRSFSIGVSNFETNRAFVWTIEAARSLAAGDEGLARKLLGMAQKELAGLTAAAD